MALAAYQKLTRVLLGKPFGDGVDGALSSASIPTAVNESCSGSSGGTALTAGGSSISDGDVILIHQSRGTGAGQYEINKVASGGGTVNLVMSENLQFTYTDSGASQAQVTVIKRYTNATVQTGTWTLPDWAGDQGGILIFAAKNILTITGTVLGTGKGFRGGAGGPQSAGTNQATQGESAVNTGTTSTSANGAAGGGGVRGGGMTIRPGGGGGGFGTGGTTGQGGADGTPGTGGGTDGSADLTDAPAGGAGGGGAGDTNKVGWAGGDSGGLIFIIAKEIATITGAVTNGGNNGADRGGDSLGGGGGGGAGGGVIIQCATAALGSGKITAPAGAGTTENADAKAGGAGGVGRIAVHHSGTVTGTTTPTFDDTEDVSLIEPTSGFLAIL